ncbi:MAG: pyrimidine 5'-nucleotidase [Anaerolineae bacterium]|nr:pyrimidine 5'-nucleotidase [Anaerolineae bacterium]
MQYTTILFDLDDTLYPPSSGVWDLISERVHQFMIHRVGIAQDQVHTLRQHYYQKYGTTMRGLILHYQIDPREYLDYVHDIPVTSVIQPAPHLRSIIQRLPYDKFIFTNSDRPHAARVLAHLQLNDLFADVVDIMDVFPACKPMEEAFDKALGKINRTAQECIFIDDNTTNLDTARRRGMFTILPHADRYEKNNTHAKIASYEDLERVLPPNLASETH